MREQLKKQLTSAEIRTVGEIHPGNRNERSVSSFQDEKVSQQKQFHNSNHSLAKCTNMFYFHGNNYFVYTCQTCGHQQIKPGKKLSYE